MADFNVSVTKNGLIPAVIYAGPEGSAGSTITFAFSSDWEGYTKEVIFFDNRGNTNIQPIIGNPEIVNIPDDIMMYGGPHKYTVRGFTLDDGLYIDDQLQVTGTVVTTYTAGHNPRLEGRILPSTLDLFLYRAGQEILHALQAAKDSGEFDAGFGEITATIESLNAGSEAQVSVEASGPNGEKNFAFDFKIPVGDSGVWVSDSLSKPPSADQNLWVLTESGDNYLWIPDGLLQENGLVYLMSDGLKVGGGVSIVGKNFTILGTYNSLASLRASVPNPSVGDAYGVGTSAPYDVYLFDGPSRNWKNYGPIGYQEPYTVDQIINSTTASSANPVSTKAVKDYVDASIPVSASVDTEMSDSSTNAVQNLVIKAYVDNRIPASLTVDTEMSDTSENAVQNQVIKAYVDELIGDVDTAIAAINAIIGGDET